MAEPLMDIMVMASGDGSTFQAIIDSCQSVNIIALVTNNKNAYAIERAKQANIPHTICQPHEVQHIECQPELVVLAGYMRIVDAEFLRRFPNTINIHPSLLPKFKGLNTYDRAIAESVCEHGATVHWVNEELDAGAIIEQQYFTVFHRYTAEDLSDRTKKIEKDMYPKVIDSIATGVIPLLHD
jgi:phosphoribosylglycinamide formyltransferase-1